MQIVVSVGVRIYVDSYWSKSTRRTAVVILTDEMKVEFNSVYRLV